MARIMRINMSDRTVKYTEVPERYAKLGGRGLTSNFLCDEVDPMCHPLGPNNKLIVAPGLMTGTVAVTSGRLSAGAKSPLTGGIKESNAGTPFSQAVAKLGLKAMIIEGSPKDDQWWGLHVTSEGAKFFSAEEYAGQGLYDAYTALIDRFGKKAHVMATGPAGQNRMAMAGICFNDMEKRPSRYAGRGGLGAVMGSKQLLCVVVDATGGPGVEIANKATFDVGRKKLAEALQSHDVTKPGGGLHTYGTAVLVNVINEAGAFPTRNFRDGRFEGAAKISGEAISEACTKRGGAGTTDHGCSPGCIIKCSSVYPNPDGTEMVSVLEYESVWAFGANCGIDDLDVIGKLIYKSNNLGIDTIEAGVTFAVAMEGGLAEFGDTAMALEFMDEIEEGSPVGRILGNGAAATAKVLGVVRCPTVKNQGMPAYEPRAIKGIGMTYAISTMGADHTSGYTIAPEILGVSGKVDPFDINKAEMVRNFQYATAFIDQAGHCVFIAFAILDIPTGFEGLVEECNGVLGTNWTMDDVGKIGKAIIDKERAFNAAAGFTKADDRMPEFMKYEKLPPHDVTWNVPDDMLDSVLG
ncbi:MAG: aldehyde ferredoxin oxidoreductase [Planctomycetes bacterium]|nr:aldehyde ferredoxin oxidoreductase [Planctomycetota bacterium]